MSAVKLVGPGAHVSIKVLGYENPHAEDASDADWLSCAIQVEVGIFQGAVAASLTIQDFLIFETQLRACINEQKNKACFVTDEEWIFFELSFEATGRVSVNGKLQSHSDPKATLTFGFVTDRYEANNLLQSTATISEAFKRNAQNNGVRF